MLRTDVAVRTRTDMNRGRPVTCAALAVLLMLFCMIAGAPASAQAEEGSSRQSATVTLTADHSSSQPVGTTITWTAQVGTDVENTEVRYQFRVGYSGSALAVLRDYHPSPSLAWTPMEEGVYVVEVAVRVGSSETVVTQQATFTIVSRLSGSSPLVTSTSHPLVLFHSAPPCSAGSLRIRFRPTNAWFWRYTPWLPCRGGSSINQYVGGLLGNTTYVLQHEEKSPTGRIKRGPLLYHSTGAVSVATFLEGVQNVFDGQTSLSDEYVLYSTNGAAPGKNYAVAVDLLGRLVWYHHFDHTENPIFPWQLGSYLVRPLSGGRFFLFVNEGHKLDQLLREIDLLGHTVRETNVEAVNRQLAQMGHDTISMFHHDAIRLENGMTLVLGSIERILIDEQGPGPVNVMTDMVIALDPSFRVVWAWNAFDHLDHTRKALMDDLYIAPRSCPPLCLDDEANDWTHTNTIHYVPADGSILLSLRNQSWVVKVNFANGAGDGRILWRLGQDGDFTIISDDPEPWFSYQHDVHFEGNQLLLFDNGNLRCQDSTDRCNSRGQVLQLDEAARTATLVVNADVGTFAPAFGSAQGLSNGNYHFLSGIRVPELSAQSVEVTPVGSISYSQSLNLPAYRSYRMRSMYEPAERPGARSSAVDPVYPYYTTSLPVISGPAR